MADQDARNLSINSITASSTGKIGTFIDRKDNHVDRMYAKSQSVVRYSRNNVFASNSQGRYANSKCTFIDYQSRYNDYIGETIGTAIDTLIGGKKKIGLAAVLTLIVRMTHDHTTALAMMAALAFTVRKIIVHTTALAMTDLVIISSSGYRTFQFWSR